MSEWISCKDRLPARHVAVAVLFKYKKGLPTHGEGINCIDRIQEKDVWAYEPEEIVITHWYPLPELPKEYHEDPQT